MTSSSSVDVTVTGRVQGVSFRAYAAQEAERLGLAGWVRNEPDGTVALHLEGSDEAVASMLAWCHDGSPAARVDRVDRVDAAASDPGSGTGFSIRH